MSNDELVEWLKAQAAQWTADAAEAKQMGDKNLSEKFVIKSDTFLEVVNHISLNQTPNT